MTKLQIQTKSSARLKKNLGLALYTQSEKEIAPIE